MTLSDFIAASQGDERLATARWLCALHALARIELRQVIHGNSTENVIWDIQHGREDRHDVLPFFAQADAVLAELARQREADKAQIEQLTIENQRLELQVTELIWQS